MVAYQHVRMDLMSSKQVSEYLKTNDMIILPVGCFEMHGASVPLSCDSYHALASSWLLADVWKCLCLPPVHYMYPGASGPWPGSVNISPEVSVAYVKEIVLSLIAGGFKRIVLYGTHGPLSFMFQMVIRSVYKETGVVVVAMQGEVMPDDLMAEYVGIPRGEDILVAASMSILGLDGVYKPENTEIDRPMEFPFESIAGMSKHGARVPWIFAKDYQHTGMRSCIKPGDVEKSVEVMKLAAQRMADLPEHFSDYQAKMADLAASPPWEKPDCWSE